MRHGFFYFRTYLKSHFMPVRRKVVNKILLIFNAYRLTAFPAKYLFLTFDFQSLPPSRQISFYLLLRKVPVITGVHSNSATAQKPYSKCLFVHSPIFSDPG